MGIALGIWAGVIVFGLVLGTFLLSNIEKSGVERWGASGKLFK
jgi:hypothetical protein